MSKFPSRGRKSTCIPEQQAEGRMGSTWGSCPFCQYRNVAAPPVRSPCSGEGQQTSQQAGRPGRCRGNQDGREGAFARGAWGGWLEGQAGTEGTGPSPTLSPKGRRLLRKERTPEETRTTEGGPSALHWGRSKQLSKNHFLHGA